MKCTRCFFKKSFHVEKIVRNKLVSKFSYWEKHEYPEVVALSSPGTRVVTQGINKYSISRRSHVFQNRYEHCLQWDNQKLWFFRKTPCRGVFSLLITNALCSVCKGSVQGFVWLKLPSALCSNADWVAFGCLWFFFLLAIRLHLLCVACLIVIATCCLDR